MIKICQWVASGRIVFCISLRCISTVVLSEWRLVIDNGVSFPGLFWSAVSLCSSLPGIYKSRMISYLFMRRFAFLAAFLRYGLGWFLLRILGRSFVFWYDHHSRPEPERILDLEGGLWARKRNRLLKQWSQGTSAVTSVLLLDHVIAWLARLQAPPQRRRYDWFVMWPKEGTSLRGDGFRSLVFTSDIQFWVQQLQLVRLHPPVNNIW